MSELPDFSPEPTAEPPAPRKPRRKPQKLGRARQPYMKSAKRRVPKKRAIRKHPALGAPYEGKNAILDKDAYRVISQLLDMPAEKRALALSVVHGLSK